MIASECPKSCLVKGIACLPDQMPMPSGASATLCKHLKKSFDGKLNTYFNLRTKTTEPAVDEVNAITPYQVTIIPKKKGKKVTRFLMGWSVKDVAGMKEAYLELKRPKFGRSARLDGTTNSVIDD